MNITGNARLELEQWLKTLVRAWEEKDVDTAVNLFSHCTTYQETPFSDNAAATPGGVRTLWNEISEQADVQITTRILCLSEQTATVRYDATYNANGSAYRSSGIWYILFDKGVCQVFEQWFMVKASENHA